MKKIPYVVILVILAFSLVLSGCSRSASSGIEPTAVDSEAEIPFPVGDTTNRTDELMAETQTTDGGAEAKGEATAAPADPTAVPVVNTPEPTAVPVVVATAAPVTAPGTYVLQEGEHPYCIARRFNVNPSDLTAVNSISGSVAPGTKLTIPSNSVWPNTFARSLKAHPTTYTVVAGDTIYTIACAFGDVDPNQIISANNLTAPYTLTAGTTLQIP